jgi:nucleotide-binding universal stress UspA family protein
MGFTKRLDRDTTLSEPQVGQHPEELGRIVVGVDGSAGSLAALDWAVHEAGLRGVGVQAVIAWQQPEAYGGATPWALGVDPSTDSKEALAAAAADEMARITGEVGGVHDVDVSYEAIEGHPAQVLVAAAEGAGLLVVGSHGHGGFVGALLGSVSQHVVGHAGCPVVVVRGS